MQEKLSQKNVDSRKTLLQKNVNSYSDPLKDKKVQVLEDEINDLRKKLIEKDRELDRAQTESVLSKPKLKNNTLRTR